MARPTQIIPSILAADYARLGEEVAAADHAGADRFHLDMIDGHVFKNLSFGPTMFQALRHYTQKPFDVHVMATPARDWIAALGHAGCNRLLIHPALEPELPAIIDAIKDHAMSVGLVLTPRDPADRITPHLDAIDFVNVMTVDPGFGGQAFLSDMMPKVTEVKHLIGDRKIDIAVDGGVAPNTAPLAAKAGANCFVAGTSIFKSASKNYSSAIAALRAAVSLSSHALSEVVR